MRSNPFATSFGKKAEPNLVEPSGGMAGYGRFARPQATPPTASAPQGGDSAAHTGGEGSLDAKTMANLRSWGLPEPDDRPRDDAAEYAHTDVSATGIAKTADIQDVLAGGAVERLREEMGADDDSDTGWPQDAGAEPGGPPPEPAATDGSATADPTGTDAAPAPTRKTPPQSVAALAPDWDEEADAGSLDDIAVTIGRVVSIRGSVIWGALFDDADGTTARAARMGALVSMRGPDSRVFGIVNSLQREPHGGNQSERTVFEVQVLGEIANTVPESNTGFQRGVSSYPPLDAPVTTVTLRDLAKVYARPRVSNVHIGRLRHNRKVPAFVLTDNLLAKHFAVLGTTGAGKSCAVTVILRSILDEHPHGHVVLLDPHNEYASAFGDKAELLNPSNLQLPYWLLSFEEIAHVLMGGAGNDYNYEQMAILKDAILHAKKMYGGESIDDGYITVDTPVPYRLSDLTALLKERMGMLNKAERSAAPYLSLVARTESLRLDKRYAFMFSSIQVRDTMRQVLGQLVRIPVEGKPITIIDISGVPSEIVDVVVSVLFRLMFELAIWSERGAAPPMLLVCEEAHRYVPQGEGTGFAPTKRVISRIAKEGRKYGITLCLVSQRPSELSITSLSQCNTVFALRMSNEHDQAFVARALSENARWLVDSLPSLNTQEAVVVGDGVTVPSHIRFKDLKRDQRPSSYDRSYSTAWRSEADPNFLDRTIERWRREAR